MEQGRDVFALPGPLGSPTSAGVHWLIQQGAYLANDPQDIIEQLGGSFQWLPPSEKPSLPKEQMTLPFADVLAHI